MKTTAQALTLILVFLLLSAVGLVFVEYAIADPMPRDQYSPIISINEGGSVSLYDVNRGTSILPADASHLISKSGNKYSLTSNVTNYEIRIFQSNIIFDGASYSINIDYGSNSALSMYGTHNVVIENVELFPLDYRCVDIRECSNCQVTNVNASGYISLANSQNNNITKCNSKIELYQSENNHITKNNITGLLLTDASRNAFYRNNMVLADCPYLSTYFPSICSWDDGSVGNYWSNYTARYPNASEIGFTGIGDTSFVLMRKSIDGDYMHFGKYFLDPTNVDHYRLILSYDIENDTLTLPMHTPELTANTDANSLSFVFVAVGFTVATILCASILIYFKRFRGKGDRKLEGS